MGASGRILVVEDDEIVASVVRYFLEREGFEVTHAADGRSARSVLASDAPPALVVLDIMLPHVSGHQLVEEIRTHPTWSRVPVIVLSARSGEHSVVRALNAGANDYVCKPFRPEELTARIKRFLRAA